MTANEIPRDDKVPPVKASEEAVSFPEHNYHLDIPFNVKLQTENLLPVLSNEARIAIASIRGLDLIKHWCFLKRINPLPVQKPSDEAINTFVKESLIIKTLYSNMRNAFNFLKNQANLEFLEKSIINLEKSVLETEKILTIPPQTKKENTEPQELTTEIDIINIPISSKEDLQDKLDNLSGISHDIGSKALTPFIGFTQMMAKLPNEYPRFRDQIQSGLRQAYETIEEQMVVLEKEEYHKETITGSQIQQVFWDYIEPELQTTAENTQKIKTIVGNIDKDVKILWSQKWLKYLLKNIASNTRSAYEARDKLKERAGSPKILIMDIFKTEGGKSVKIRFRDNGIGFDDDKLQNGFIKATKFGYREEEVTSRGEKPVASQGAGMARHERIITDHYNGKIELSNYTDSIEIEGIRHKIQGAETTIVFSLAENNKVPDQKIELSTAWN